MSTESRRLKLAFYGDDFTGSTDALEVLAFAATTHRWAPPISSSPQRKEFYELDQQ